MKMSAYEFAEHFRLFLISNLIRSKLTERISGSCIRGHVNYTCNRAWHLGLVSLVPVIGADQAISTESAYAILTAMRIAMRDVLRRRSDRDRYSSLIHERGVAQTIQRGLGT